MLLCNITQPDHKHWWDRAIRQGKERKRKEKGKERKIKKKGNDEKKGKEEKQAKKGNEENQTNLISEKQRLCPSSRSGHSH